MASRAYAWYVVGVLIVAYAFSYIDRTILTLMVGPIRQSLAISDLQVSLLHGLAFAMLYTVLGFPIGRLVDRRKRVGIVAAGIVVWSVMTAVCGLARTFTQMFVARVGVGVGEAALSPASYSILADYFRGKSLARALSIYTGASYAGGGLALIVGGTLIGSVPSVTLPLVGFLEPWRVVFLIVGLPGLALGLWALTLREPARTTVVRSVEAPDADAHPSVAQVLRWVWRHRRLYALTIGGVTASSLVWNGANFWLPEMFVREFGWTKAAIGIRLGVALLCLGTTGIAFGGWLGGWLRDRGRLDSNLLVGIASALLVLVFGTLAPLAPTGGLALAGVCAFVFVGTMPYGCAAATLQELTPNAMRGQVSALYLFLLNLFGIGLGPATIALVGRLLPPERLGVALAVTAAIGSVLSIVLLALARRPCRDMMARALA